MKKYFSLIIALIFVFANAQQSANRFFYELTFKPKKDSSNSEKIMTILDITDTESIYRDYLMVSQDSILKVEIEKIQRAGIYKDVSKILKQPKFSHKISKVYPSKQIIFSDYILRDQFSYKEDLNFNWEIKKDKRKIGEYESQMATAFFGGRKWIAWFTPDIPFQDGPYKFHGLPGLIVKIEDTEKNYSWELKANKRLTEYSEITYSEKMMKQLGQGFIKKEVDRAKFEKVYETYKKDPFGSIRDKISQIPQDAKMPDGTSLAEMMKTQEDRLKKSLNENNNPIEISTVAK